MYRTGSKGIWGLAGDSQRNTRQTIMRLLTGENRPKAKCGVNALEEVVSELESNEYHAARFLMAEKLYL
jgi:hypothetical protein